MDHRQRILNAIRGEPTGQIPWVPRLEFWHRARVRNGTIPADLRGMELSEIAHRIGAAVYARIPHVSPAEPSVGAAWQ